MPTFLETNRSPVSIPNPDFQSIGAGLRATARVPIGSTLLTTFLHFTIAGVAATRAQIEAQVSIVRITVDAENKFDLTGVQACALADFYRTGIIANGILPIFWARPWMREIANVDAPGLGLAEADSASIEITLAAGATIDAIRAIHESVAGEPLGAHPVYLRQNFLFSSTGQFEITDLPRNPLFSLFALHVQCDPSTITDVEVVADNVQILKGTVAELNERYLLDTSPRKVQDSHATPANRFFSLDWTYRNRGSDPLPLNMQDWRIRLTFNAAPNTLPIVFEQLRVAPSKGRQA